MKRFSELTTDEFKAIVEGSKSLGEKLYERIHDSEMMVLEEKIELLRKGMDKWSVGVCEPCFFRVSDHGWFLEGVLDSIHNFGCSERLEKLVKQCEKLSETNLFNYYVENLADLYLKEEIMPYIDYLSDCSYEIYCKKIGKNCSDYINLFQEDLCD